MCRPFKCMHVIRDFTILRFNTTLLLVMTIWPQRNSNYDLVKAGNNEETHTERLIIFCCVCHVVLGMCECPQNMDTDISCCSTRLNCVSIILTLNKS